MEGTLAQMHIRQYNNTMRPVSSNNTKSPNQGIREKCKFKKKTPAQIPHPTDSRPSPLLTDISIPTPQNFQKINPQLSIAPDVAIMTASIVNIYIKGKIYSKGKDESCDCKVYIKG